MLAGSADLAERIRDSGFRELPISFEHAIAAGHNPRIHRDPFDRMLIAQARCEELTLVTRDTRCKSTKEPFFQRDVLATKGR
jgi:PIN domain nuclease of toxin-antitoxin system